MKHLKLCFLTTILFTLNSVLADPEPRYFMTFGYENEMAWIDVEKRGMDTDIEIFEEPKPTSELIKKLIIPTGEDNKKKWDFLYLIQRDFKYIGGRDDLIYGFKKENNYIKVKYKGKFSWIHSSDFAGILNYESFFLLVGKGFGISIPWKNFKWIFKKPEGERVADYIPSPLKKENWPDDENREKDDDRPLYSYKDVVKSSTRLMVEPMEVKLVSNRIWVKINVCKRWSQKYADFIDCEKPVFYWLRPFDNNGNRTDWQREIYFFPPKK